MREVYQSLSTQEKGLLLDDFEKASQILGLEVSRDFLEESFEKADASQHGFLSSREFENSLMFASVKVCLFLTILM